ncbi:glycerate kinase [Candidatus Falkowbacteria bacterium]|nr:MAG: glycerate kinase [Candidatus Falkowbacteria bacterium]
MEIIKNKKEIGSTESRKQTLEIIEAGIKSVNPKTLIKDSVMYDSNLNSVIINNNAFDIISGRIFVIGGGKASGAMAEALEEIIGADNITAGVINSDDEKYKLEKIKIIKAGHPLPDRNGVKGVEQMLKLKEKHQINEKDLIICLISGGGSAMMPCPVETIKLKDKQDLTQLLIESGASINEINAVRKHLSKIKGGQLAKYFFSSRVVSIIISDVVGNKLESIASGITVPDPTTFGSALAVLEKYNLDSKAPKSVLNYLKNGMEGKIEETAKEVKNVDNFIIGKNATALEAMAHKAKSLGLIPLIVSSELSGEPAIAAELMAEEINKGEYSKYNVIILGGETTPSLPVNYGKGGRNMHYTAVSLLALENIKNNWVIASAATDGQDYLKNVAGAIIDNNSLSLARAKEIDVEKYIKNFDTYSLFKKLENSLIKTERTGTNVGDVVVYLLR